MPREKPILFSGPMVRALLDGRKTQTRRIVRGIPADAVNVRLVGDDLKFGDYAGPEAQPGRYGRIPCPYGDPGDRLWVRETWARDVEGCDQGLSYRADHIDPLGDGPANPMRWRPSIYMPRWASRITLGVTDVRAQRLQAISECDILAEGVEQQDHEVLRDTWARLWDSINDKRAAWASNPWVWAVTFSVIRS